MNKMLIQILSQIVMMAQIPLQILHAVIALRGPPVGISVLIWSGHRLGFGVWQKNQCIWEQIVFDQGLGG